MNGSGSFNLSGHLLMSLGVSVVLGGGRGTIRKISSAAPLQAPLLRSQRGLAAFWGPLSQRLRTRVRLPNCWYSDSSFLHTLIHRQTRGGSEGTNAYPKALEGWEPWHRVCA